MDLVFLSSAYVEELKSQIIEGEGLVVTNLRRELEMRAGEVSSLNMETATINHLANDIIALCNAGYYLGQNHYLKVATAVIDKMLETSMDEEDVVSQFESLCMVMQGVSLLSLSEIDLTYVEKVKTWLEKVNTILVSDEAIQLYKSRKDGAYVWSHTYLSAYTMWCGDDALGKQMVETYKNEVLPSISGDEILMQTKNSMSTMVDTLNAMALMCEIAYQKGIDIWQYESAVGDSFVSILKPMITCIKNPYLWKYPMADGEIPEDLYAFQYAAMRLGMDSGLVVNENRRSARYMIRDQRPLGPLVLLPGSPILKNTQIYSKIGFSVRGYSHSK